MELYFLIIDIVFAIFVGALLISSFFICERELKIMYYNPNPRFDNKPEKRLAEIEIVPTRTITLDSED